jgi:hypothetical protein
VEGPTVSALRAAGHNVLCVAETSPGIEDAQVLGIARREQALLFTADKDFWGIGFPQPGNTYRHIADSIAGRSRRERCQHSGRHRTVRAGSAQPIFGFDGPRTADQNCALTLGSGQVALIPEIRLSASRFSSKERVLG